MKQLKLYTFSKLSPFFNPTAKASLYDQRSVSRNTYKLIKLLFPFTTFHIKYPLISTIDPLG